MSAISRLEGPILVTGATGFIGAHLLRALQDERDDAFGAAPSPANWRQQELDLQRIFTVGNREQLLHVLDLLRPRTIFNLAAHGAYAFQTDRDRIIETDLVDVMALTDWAEEHGACLVQAGSSSEYGSNCTRPSEDATLRPNSEYAVAKASASQWLEYRVREGGLKACSLRLYSVFGPLEDPRRLMPTLVRNGALGRWPGFAGADVSRDFVYVEDAVDAFIRAADALRAGSISPVLNIASGVETTMRDIAAIADGLFDVSGEPEYNEVSRPWDLTQWVGDATLAGQQLDWHARTSVHDGLVRMRDWYAHGDRARLLTPPATASTATGDSRCEAIDVSVIVACYRDAQAIPFMHARVSEVMARLGLRHELILVNDASPDDTLDVIERLSAEDPSVIGITHARNFGSQAAFLSGMRASRGEWVALLDGDLQDPPELLADFWAKQLEGFDVVYGVRADREAPWIMRRAYKAFYVVFQRLAPFRIPRDAGDFSLMSREVADVIMDMPERDLFIRAQRAYAGFRQAGVEYVRPERMFGRSTNNLGRNLGWATRGVLAVSRAPLTGLSVFALAMFFVAAVLVTAQIVAKIVFPESAPQGFVSLAVLVLGLGALNLLAIAVVGEYVGRILEETKRRPRYIRRLITRRGVTKPNAERDATEDF